MATGFREQVFEHQVLQIAQSLRVDAKLVIGEQSDVVEVTTQTANIETQSETVGGTVVGEAIQQAPLNGRNVLDLAKLQPGVTETNGDSTAAGTYSIVGGRSDSVTFLLDAIEQQSAGQQRGPQLNPDTIANLNSESNYSASMTQWRRRNQRGNKSGTNTPAAHLNCSNDDFNAAHFQ
jgi:hypothetical protein